MKKMFNCLGYVLDQFYNKVNNIHILKLGNKMKKVSRLKIKMNNYNKSE